MAQNQNRGVAPYTSRDVMIPEGFTENVDLIIQTYARELTPQEFSLFAADAHQRGLSIVKRQIYASKYGGKMTIMVGIDGYRSQAESHPDYAGQDGPYWCGSDGHWEDVWTANEPPAAAKVGIYRKGFQAPVYGIALWSEYNSPSNPSWKKFPTTMLAKCAEAQAIRKAFPSKLGGTYIAEEMDQANAVETTGHVVRQEAVAAEVVDTDTGEITEFPKGPGRSGADKSMARLHAVAAKHGLTHDDLHRMAVAVGAASLSDTTAVWRTRTADRIEANPEEAKAYAAKLALSAESDAAEPDEGEPDEASSTTQSGLLIDISPEQEAEYRRRRQQYTAI